MYKIPCIKTFVSKILIPRITRAYDVFSNWNEAHENALTTLKQSLVQKEIKVKIEKEIKDELKSVQEIISGQFKTEFSDIVRAVNLRRGEYYVLVQLIKHYENLSNNG